VKKPLLPHRAADLPLSPVDHIRSRSSGRYRTSLGSDFLSRFLDGKAGGLPSSRSISLDASNTLPADARPSTPPRASGAEFSISSEQTPAPQVGLQLSPSPFDLDHFKQIDNPTTPFRSALPSMSPLRTPRERERTVSGPFLAFGSPFRTPIGHRDLNDLNSNYAEELLRSVTGGGHSPTAVIQEESPTRLWGGLFASPSLPSPGAWGSTHW